MALQVVRATPTIRLQQYLWQLSPSQDWPPELQQGWQAASAAHHTLIVLEETRAAHGMLRSMMLDRLIDHATHVWQEIEAYYRPLCEGLAR